MLTLRYPAVHVPHVLVSALLRSAKDDSERSAGSEVPTLTSLAPTTSASSTTPSPATAAHSAPSSGRPSECAPPHFLITAKAAGDGGD